jgi:hypothetical protein
MQQHPQAVPIVFPTTFWTAFRQVQAGLPHRLPIECSNDSGPIFSSFADYSQLKLHTASTTVGNQLSWHRLSCKLYQP